MPGLGYLYDIGTVIVPPTDLAGQGNTGHRIHLSGYESVTFVTYLGAVSAGSDTFVIDVQQHTAATGGTSADLDASGVAGTTGVTVWHHKSEAAPMDGDETWTTVTQAAASEVSLTGGTYAALQMLIVIEVEASALAPGYSWISVDIADPGTGGTRAGGVLAILNRPPIQRAPANLPQLNA